LRQNRGVSGKPGSDQQEMGTSSPLKAMSGGGGKGGRTRGKKEKISTEPRQLQKIGKRSLPRFSKKKGGVKRTKR